MYLFDDVKAQERVQLASTCSRAPDVNTSHGARGTEDDRTAGDVLEVAGVADGKARYASDHGRPAAGEVTISTRPSLMVRMYKASSAWRLDAKPLNQGRWGRSRRVRSIDGRSDRDI